MSRTIAAMVRFAFVIAVVVSLCACQIGEKKVTNVTEADNGKTIHFKMGEDLQFDLIRDPQSSLDWAAQGYDPTLIKQVHSCCTGSEKLALIFEPLARGTTTFQLVYHQPGHPDVPPAKSFAVTVIID